MEPSLSVQGWLPCLFILHAQFNEGNFLVKIMANNKIKKKMGILIWFQHDHCMSSAVNVGWWKNTYVLNIRESCGRLDVIPEQNQAPVTGMRYSGVILCFIWFELSLFFHKKKLHPRRKLVKNQLKGVIQWEAPLKTKATTAIRSPQVVFKAVNVARQSVSQSGRLSCKCVPAGRAKLQSKASSLESATFPCCSSSLQPTQEEAHGHKFESLTRCGFKTICMSLSLSFSLSLTPPHSVWNVPLIHPLLCSALLSFPTNSTVNENGKVFFRTCQ